jgi:hypothetical protein
MAPRMLASLAVGACTALAIGPAAAASIGLSWDACVTGSGTPVVDKSATTPASYTIALTGNSLAGRVAGTRFVFEVRSPGGLPDAWRFDAAGCAAGAIQVVTGTISKSCPAIGSLPSTSATMTLDSGGQAGTLTISVIYNGTVDLQPSSTYSLGRILLDFDGSCAGLDRPVCLSLVEATFLPLDGSGEEDIATGQAFLTWNDPAGETACSARTLRGIAVEELMTACSFFDLGTQFVELSPPPGGSVLPGELRMRVEDRNGVVLADTDVVTPGRVGEPWPDGTSWLLGTPTFETGSGLQADHAITPLLDPDGGRILLYDARPGGPVVQDLAYGPAAPVPAPLRGQSLTRTAEGEYVPATVPAPRTFTGQTSGRINCVQAPEPPVPPSGALFRISEVAYGCFSGHRSGQFVEIQSLNDSTWNGPLLLEILDAQGTIVGQIAGVFGAVNGTITPHQRSWLVATQGFHDSFEPGSVIPDQVWQPFPILDELTFRLRSPLYGTVDQTTLGGASTIAPPLDGLSVAFAEDGSFACGFPTATNSAGMTLGPTLCFPAPLGPLEGPCPFARLATALPGTSAFSFWTARAFVDTTQFGLRVAFDRTQPIIQLRTTNYLNPVVTLDDRFTLLGGVPGEEVEILARFHAFGSSSGGCLPVHGCSDASADLSWATPDTTGGENLGGNFDRFVHVPLRVRIGEPFAFLWRLGFWTQGYSSIFADFTATLRFANLPPGTHVESCMGYFDDAPVPIRPSILTAVVEHDMVRLEWSALDPELGSPMVERRRDEEDWVAIGVPEFGRTLVRFEDRDVEPGARYGYRLRWTAKDGGVETTDEVTVEVPGLAFSARLRNTVTRAGSFDLMLSVSERREVHLALYDLRGRRLAARAWMPERTGTQEVAFAPGRLLAPGVYWIRAQQGAGQATLRAVVLGGQ